MDVFVFAVSFLVFIIVGAALAIGLFVGRDPIQGRCHPDKDGVCAEKGSCGVRCEKRRITATKREA